MSGQMFWMKVVGGSWGYGVWIHEELSIEYRWCRPLGTRHRQTGLMVHRNPTARQLIATYATPVQEDKCGPTIQVDHVGDWRCKSDGCTPVCEINMVACRQTDRGSNGVQIFSTLSHSEYSDQRWVRMKNQKGVSSKGGVANLALVMIEGEMA